MSFSNLNRANAILAELDEDFLTEEVCEEDRPKLLVVDQITQLREPLPSPPVPVYDEESESAALSEEKEKELNSVTQSGFHSSLEIYFKTISGFPLLKKDEEIALAKQIKEREQECKDLVINWKNLFEKEFLKRFSAKKVKEISETLHSLNGAYHLFDDIITWEKKRKKITLALKRLTYRSKTKQRLQDNLCKVESEISKCIAEISLSSTRNTGTLRNVKKQSQNKKHIKKQQRVEKGLNKTLRQIARVAKEIKLLKNELAQANLRLVISIAKKYAYHRLPLPDLIQEGNLGLMRAINTYDYRRGYRLTTYAIWWIKQSIIRSLDCQSRTIRTPVYINNKMNQIEKVSDQLLQKYKRKPTLEEIAKTTNTSLESIEKVVQSPRNDLSLDTFIEENDERSINGSLNHKNSSILERISSSNLSQVMELILSNLTQRERDIAKFRFGIGEKRDHTLEEIGEEFNLSRERVRQILEKTLRKLKAPNNARKLKEFIEFN